MERGEKIGEMHSSLESNASKMDEAVLSAEAFTHGGVRKTKFVPKVPVRRLKKLSEAKREAEDAGDNALPSELQLLVKQSQEDAANRRANRFDNKGNTHSRVAFGFGSTMAGRTGSGSAGFYKGSTVGGNRSGPSGSGGHSSGGGWHGSEKKPSIKNINGPEIFDGGSQKMKSQFVEPMDTTSYGPVKIPFRSRAFSVIDHDADGIETFDEDAVPPAKELELMCSQGEDVEERLLFFQLPSTLPIANVPLITTDGQLSSPSTNENTVGSAGAPTNLNNLPSGLVGKLLVFESGAVKLKIGDISLEAVPGVQCAFAQEVAAINSSSRHCCFLGDLTQRVVLTPDIDSLLN